MISFAGELKNKEVKTDEHLLVDFKMSSQAFHYVLKFIFQTMIDHLIVLILNDIKHWRFWNKSHILFHNSVIVVTL